MSSRKRKLPSTSPENYHLMASTVDSQTITVATAAASHHDSPNPLLPMTPPLPNSHQQQHDNRIPPHQTPSDHLFAIPVLPSGIPYAPSSSAGTSSTVKRRRGGNTTTSVNADGVSSSHYCPSVNSSTFRYPSDSTKMALGRRDGWQCWLCGIRRKSRLETVHKVAANVEIERLNEWKSMGILPSSFHPASIHNLMILCSNCHDSYDATYPHWMLLPADLSLFVSHELSDYESRVAVAAAGKIPPGRTFPSASEARRYTPCFLADVVSESGITLSDFPKAWMGNPATVVLKAAMSAFMPVKRVATSPDREGNSVVLGMDEETRSRLAELLRLWSRPDPVAAAEQNAKTSSPSQNIQAKEESESEDEEKDKEPKADKRGRKRGLRKRTSPAEKEKGKAPLVESITLTPPSPNQKRKRDEHDTPLPAKRQRTTTKQTHDPLTPPDTTTPHTSPKQRILRARRKTTVSPLENVVSAKELRQSANAQTAYAAAAVAVAVAAHEDNVYPAYPIEEDGGSGGNVWGPEMSTNDMLEQIKVWDDVRKEDAKERKKRKAQQQKEKKGGVKKTKSAKGKATKGKRR